MKHGASAYRARNNPCRCDVCREDHRTRQAAESARRKAARAEVDGQLIAPVAAERHGVVSTYVNHWCRCEPCRKAVRRYNRQAHSRRVAS